MLTKLSIEDRIAEYMIANNIRIVNQALDDPNYEKLRYIQREDRSDVQIGHLTYNRKTGKPLFGKIYVKPDIEKKDEIVLDLVVPVCNLLLETEGNYCDQRWEQVRLASIRANRTAINDVKK